MRTVVISGASRTPMGGFRGAGTAIAMDRP
jgi:hypothetical protein